MLTTAGFCRIGASSGQRKDRWRGVGCRPGKRNVAPAEPRRAHLDGKTPFAGAPGDEPPAAVLKDKLLPRAAAQQRPGDATGSVATGAGLGAVGVENSDESLGARRARLMQRHQLVERKRFVRAIARASAALTAKPAPRRSRTRILVAETVHLGYQPVGERNSFGASFFRACAFI